MLNRITRSVATLGASVFVVFSIALLVSCGSSPMGPSSSATPADGTQSQVAKPSVQPTPAAQENPPAPGIEVGEARTGEDAQVQTSKPVFQPTPAAQENPPAPGIDVAEASTGEDATD